MREELQLVVENTGKVFRHVLPGVVILVGARAGHPGWFYWANLGNVSHLAALAALAIVVGNTWYVFHRYLVHQLVDMVFYAWGHRGPGARSPGLRACLRYWDDLPRFVVKAFKSEAGIDLRKHVELRASSMHLMFMASEVCFLFSFLPEPLSPVGKHYLAVRIFGAVGFILTLWQNALTRRIDWYRVEGLPYDKSAPAGESRPVVPPEGVSGESSI